MNVAMANQHFSDYFEARLEVEALEKDGRSEEELLAGINLALSPEESTDAPKVEATGVDRLAEILPTLESIDFGASKSGTVVGPAVFLGEEPSTGRKLLFGDEEGLKPSSVAPVYVRVQLDRPIEQSLTAEEHETLAGLVGFMNKSVVHSQDAVGENWWMDSNHSIVAAVDFNQSRDSRKVMEEFNDNLQEYVTDGSPARRNGTRLVSGLKGAPTVRLWFGYDAEEVAEEEPGYISRLADSL